MAAADLPAGECDLGSNCLQTLIRDAFVAFEWPGQGERGLQINDSCVTKDRLVHASNSELAHWRAVAGFRYDRRDAYPRQAGHLRRHVPYLQSHLGASLASIIASGHLMPRSQAAFIPVLINWRVTWTGEPCGGRHERSVGFVCAASGWTESICNTSESLVSSTSLCMNFLSKSPTMADRRTPFDIFPYFIYEPHPLFLMYRRRRIDLGLPIISSYDEAKNKSRVQYCVELYSVGQAYRDSPRTSILSLLFAAVTVLSSSNSAESVNLKELTVVRVIRMLRDRLVQWAHPTCGERGGLGMLGNTREEKRNEIIESMKREAQIVAEAATMRVRVYA